MRSSPLAARVSATCPSGPQPCWKRWSTAHESTDAPAAQDGFFVTHFFLDNRAARDILERANFWPNHRSLTLAAQKERYRTATVSTYIVGFLLFLAFGKY